MRLFEEQRLPEQVISLSKTAVSVCCNDDAMMVSGILTRMLFPACTWRGDKLHLVFLEYLFVLHRWHCNQSLLFSWVGKMFWTYLFVHRSVPLIGTCITTTSNVWKWLICTRTFLWITCWYKILKPLNSLIMLAVELFSALFSPQPLKMEVGDYLYSFIPLYYSRFEIVYCSSFQSSTPYLTPCLLNKVWKWIYCVINVYSTCIFSHIQTGRTNCFPVLFLGEMNNIKY